MQPACLFKHIHVLTADPDQPERFLSLPDACVAVQQGTITAVSQDPQKVKAVFQEQPHDSVDGRGKLLLPALANLHGHVPMTLFRNQSDDYNLHDWLFQVIFPREARLDADLVRKGTLLGIAEMIRSGTGAAADMYYFHEAVAEAAVNSGFRLNFCCDSKESREDGKEQVNARIMENAIRLAHSAPDDLLRASLLVHSVYLHDPEIYPQLAELALALDCPVQVHVSETAREVSDCLARYGQRPPRQLLDFGFFKTPTLAAHCVHLDDDDRRILSDSHITCVHNPSSNLKLGSGFADVQSMLQAGIRVGLGTDGAASNNNLDLYREMRQAAFLAKGLNGDARALPAETVLRMATIEGMQGLGFPQSGQIAVGCAADLQVIDLSQPELTPLGQPAAAMVYSGGAAQVESLMVGGRWLMKKRELQTIDLEKVQYEAQQAAIWINRS